MSRAVSRHAVSTVIVLVLTLVCCCAGRHRTQPLNITPSKITALPGYWEGDLDEPVFGGKIHLLEAGPPGAPAVLLVHGLGEKGAGDWYPLIPDLAGHYRVIAPDLPGFARSTHANTLYSPERYAELLQWLVGRTVTGRLDVIGHSLGGAISLLYAGTYPDRVRRLVLADVAGVLDRHAFVGHLSSARRGLFSQMKQRSGEVMGVAMPLLLNLSEAIDTNPRKLLETPETREKRLDGDPRKIAGLAMILHNFGPAISAVDAPTLLLWGAEDPIAPVRTGILLDERLDNSRLSVLEEVGHVPMVDQPRLFGTKIKAFLEAPDESVAAAPTPSPDFVPGRNMRDLQKIAPVYEGDFDRLEIVSCERATIRDARIKELVVKRSAVTIERTEILGEELGIRIEGAQLRMTGGAISGRTAIRTHGAVIDLAGVLFDVRDNLLQCDSGSQVVFSVCPVKQAGGQVTYLHGFEAVGKGTRPPP